MITVYCQKSLGIFKTCKYFQVEDIFLVFFIFIPALTLQGFDTVTPALALPLNEQGNSLECQMESRVGRLWETIDKNMKMNDDALICYFVWT